VVEVVCALKHLLNVIVAASGPPVVAL